jgi:hypothetical protein
MSFRVSPYCVGIHENCTAAEILVFGRETGFLIQTLQRWYMYKSHQEMETNLNMFFKAAI